MISARKLNGKQSKAVVGHEGASPRAPHSKPHFTLNDLSLRRAISPPVILVRCPRPCLSLPPLLHRRSVLPPRPRVAHCLRGLACLQGSCRAASWLGSRSCPMSAATRHSMTIYARVNDTAGFVHVQALPVPYFSWEHSHRRHHPQHLLDWARRGVRPKVQGGGPVVLLAVLQQPTWPSPSHRADAAGGLADLSRTQRIRLEPRRLCMPPQPERTNVLPEGEDPGLYLQRLDHGRILRTNGGFAWLLHVYGLPLLVVNPSLVVVTYLAAHAPRAPPLTTTWVSGTGSDGRWPPRTGTVALSWARSWSTT